MNLEDKLFKSEKFDAQAGVRYSLTNPDAYMGSNIIGFMNVADTTM